MPFFFLDHTGGWLTLSQDKLGEFMTELRRIGLAPAATVTCTFNLKTPDTTVDSVLALLQRMPDRKAGTSEYGSVDGMVHRIGEISEKGTIGTRAEMRLVAVSESAMENGVQSFSYGEEINIHKRKI